ncbi:MAG: polysaccharide biosynthesis protein, partial [Fermentimonas sp.]|nr:polysaccharide biosynthesis protein [Fermentimonas sp.]
MIFFNTISFVTLRTFSGILRFSSFTDLMRIVYALVLGYGLTFISVLILRNFQSGFHLDNLTFISIFFLNTFLMIFSRILVKEVYETITGNDRKPVNVFIYGTKEAGISVAKALRGNNEFNYRVLGF